MDSSRTCPCGAPAFSGEGAAHTIPLPGRTVVKSGSVEFYSVPVGLARLFTRLAVGGFKLVQLRVPLAGELALRGFAVEIRTRAVVQSSVQVDPNLRVGIAFVAGSFGSFRQSETDQNLVERGKVRIGSGLFPPIRAPGNRSSAARGTDGVIGPDSPPDHRQHQNDCDRQIEIAAPGTPEAVQGVGSAGRRKRFQKVTRSRGGTPDHISLVFYQRT